MKTNKSKKLVQVLAVGAAALLGAVEARATNYTIGGTVGVDLEGGWSLSIDGTDESGYVGAIKLTAGPVTINTVCTDIAGVVYLNSTYNYTQKTFAAAPTSGIAPFWGSVNTPGYLSTHANVVNTASATQGIQNAAYLFAQYGSYLTSGTLSQKAAVQIAVWAALYDSGNSQDWATDLSYSSGTTARFHAAAPSGDAAALTTAIGWLNSALGSDGTGAHTTYSGNVLYSSDLNANGTKAQEMLYMPTPVPEPTTVLAGVMLLLPFGASAIRHVRKQKTV